jgi:N-acetyltransferase
LAVIQFPVAICCYWTCLTHRGASLGISVVAIAGAWFVAAPGVDSKGNHLAELRHRGDSSGVTQTRVELQPTLEGSLVRLRPLREDDWDALFAVASDPLIWEQHPESDRYTSQVFRRYFQGALDSGGAFIVLDAKTGEVIGSTRYHGYDPEKREIEIGWTFLARAYWGGVYNREMKELLLRHAFQFVDSVVFLIGPQNIRSQRGTEKIGAVRDGSQINADGSESFVYRLTRERWQASDRTNSQSA